MEQKTYQPLESGSATLESGIATLDSGIATLDSGSSSGRGARSAPFEAVPSTSISQEISRNVLDFSVPDTRTPPLISGESTGIVRGANDSVKVVAPTSYDGALPAFGISTGTDVFLPDVSWNLDKASASRDPRNFDKSVSREPLIARADGKAAAESDANEKISKAAQGTLEKKPWVGSEYEPNLSGGRLAGAASVSLVLQGLGYSYADSANVGTLSKQLIDQGWKSVPLDQAKEGDIIYGGKLGKDWRAGGGNAHIGVIGPDGKILHNNPKTGVWTADSKEESFPPGTYGNQVWVLRPPEGAPKPPVRPNRPDGPDRPDRPDQPGPRPRPQPEVRPDKTVDPRVDVTPRPDEVPRPGEEGIRAKIVGVAKRSVDEPMWAKGPFRNSVNGGRLGCAASVSEVLKLAGYKYANSAGVGGLADMLKQNGWTKVDISQARPGDVVFGGKPGTRWWEGGGNAHIGIVGENGSVYHNSSGKRRWVHDDSVTKVFNTHRFGNQRWVLRPPQA